MKKGTDYDFSEAIADNERFCTAMDESMKASLGISDSQFRKFKEEYNNAEAEYNTKAREAYDKLDRARTITDARIAPQRIAARERHRDLENNAYVRRHATPGYLRSIDNECCSEIATLEDWRDAERRPYEEEYSDTVSAARKKRDETLKKVFQKYSRRS